MSAYGYRGRHRKPSNTGKVVARAAVASAVAAGPSLTMVGTASAAPDWSAIIACESGGNPQAQNSSSTASGLFQFINGTWKAYGGSTSRARDASVAEQYAVANRAYAAEGFSPWSASKSCWQGRTRAATPAQVAKQRTEQVQAKPRQAASPAFDSGRATDGSGSYTCDAGHLHFAACDPETLGQRVAYPPYGRAAAPVASRGGYTVKAGDTLTSIAAVRDTTWREIAARNADAVRNPDLIFPGQHLDV